MENFHRNKNDENRAVESGYETPMMIRGYQWNLTKSI